MVFLTLLLSPMRFVLISKWHSKLSLLLHSTFSWAGRVQPSTHLGHSRDEGMSPWVWFISVALGIFRKSLNHVMAHSNLKSAFSLFAIKEHCEEQNLAGKRRDYSLRRCDSAVESQIPAERIIPTSPAPRQPCWVMNFILCLTLMFL